MRKVIITYIALLLLTVGSVHAQSVPFVNFNGDARTAAMGNAGSVLPGAFAVRQNMAATVLSAEKAQVGASYLSWQPNAIQSTNINVGGYYNTGKITIGAGFSHNGYDKMELTNEFGVPTETVTPKDMMVELGLGIGFTSNLSGGVALRFINSDIGVDKASAVGIDLSLMYALDKLRAGLTVSNIGSAVKYRDIEYNLPSRAKLGLAYQLVDVDKHSLQAAADVGYQFVSDYSGVLGGVGAEYLFNNMVAVRGGYHFADKAIGASYASVGAGVRVSVVGLDFAYLVAGNDSPVNNSFVITGRISF